MKKTLIAFTLLASIGFSCTPKEVTETESVVDAEVITEPENLALSGVYNVGAFTTQIGMQKEAIALLGTPYFGDIPFNFISEDSVILDKAFGDAIFGASAFSYELTNDKLTFITPEQRIEMSYEENAGMKLTLENQYFASLNLVKK